MSKIYSSSKFYVLPVLKKKNYLEVNQELGYFLDHKKPAFR